MASCIIESVMNRVRHFRGDLPVCAASSFLRIAGHIRRQEIRVGSNELKLTIYGQPSNVSVVGLVH